MEINNLLANATDFTVSDIRQMLNIISDKENQELVNEATSPQVFRLHWFQLKKSIEVVLGRASITAIESCDDGLVEAIIGRTISDRKVGIVSIPDNMNRYLVFDGGASVRFRQEVLEQACVTDADLVQYGSDEYKNVLSKFEECFEEVACRGVLPFNDKQDQHLEQLFQCWINCWDLDPNIGSEIRFWSEPNKETTPKKRPRKKDLI